MTLWPMYPTRSDLRLNKMSVSQLEQFVTCIVRSSCGNTDLDLERKASIDKRNAIPTYPLTRARTTDSKWRETLLNVVARCKNRVTTRRRLKSTHVNDENLNNHIVCRNFASPVVKLSDILSQTKSINTVNKTDFLNYFKLSDTQNCSVIISNNAFKKNNHSLHLLNTQNVPFSSDLGRKMTKDNHFVPEEIHQRKIERLERYLTTAINTDTAKPIEYEVSFSKHPQCSHTYVFPSKIYRRKERISSKATFIMINYCKPCTVRLEKLEINNNLPTINISKKEEFISKENLPLPKNNPNELVLQTLLPKSENLILKPNNHINVQTSVILSPIKNLLRLNTSKIEKVNKKIVKNKCDKSRKLVEKIGRVQKKRVIIYETRRFSVRVLRLRCITNKK